MEFYEGISSRLRVSSLVSIPNGMEFYADMLQKDFAYTPLFQFPTGWNSTFFFAFILYYSWGVSIPNGMEFYFLLWSSNLLRR